MDKQLLSAINSKTSDYEERILAIASNPHTPGSVLNTIFENTDSEKIILAIAKNPNTPAYVLIKIASGCKKVPQENE